MHIQDSVLTPLCSEALFDLIMNGEGELQPHEQKEWNMYTALKKHKIMPWDNVDTNPEGVKYPEDIRAIREFDKIVEHKIDQEARRQKTLQDLKGMQGLH